MTGVRSTPRRIALEGVLSPQTTAAPPTPASPQRATSRRRASPKTTAAKTPSARTPSPKPPVAKRPPRKTTAPETKTPKTAISKTATPKAATPKTTTSKTASRPVAAPSSGAGRSAAPATARRSGRTATGGRRPAEATAPSTGSAAPVLAPAPQPRPSRPEGELDRHLRVVGARPRIAWSGRRRARILCFAASIAAIVVAFGLVYLHVLSAQKQFEIDRLTVVEQTAQSNYEQLRLTVESANSPARIMAAAERLGMLEPASVTVVKGVGPVGSPAEDVVRPGAEAPGGVADYSNNKTSLADPP